MAPATLKPATIHTMLMIALMRLQLDPDHGPHRFYFQRGPSLYRFDDVRSRPTFHISPQARQRQYVDESIFSLAVAMFDDRQNGQVVGGGSGSDSFTIDRTKA